MILLQVEEVQMQVHGYCCYVNCELPVANCQLPALCHIKETSDGGINLAI